MSEAACAGSERCEGERRGISGVSEGKCEVGGPEGDERRGRKDCWLLAVAAGGCCGWLLWRWRAGATRGRLTGETVERRLG